MASWHQKRAAVPLYHSTMWTLLTDPPGEACSGMLFQTESAAIEQLERWKANGAKHAKHSYILPPGGVRPPGQAGVPTLESRCGSWVVVDRRTGKAVLETFSADVAAAVNAESYEVLTALQWLQRLNRSQEESAR